MDTGITPRGCRRRLPKAVSLTYSCGLKAPLNDKSAGGPTNRRNRPNNTERGRHRKVGSKCLDSLFGPFEGNLTGTNSLGEINGFEICGSENERERNDDDEHRHDHDTGRREGGSSLSLNPPLYRHQNVGEQDAQQKILEKGRTIATESTRRTTIRSRKNPRTTFIVDKEPSASKEESNYSIPIDSADPTQI